jgi:hypothetical protein
MTETSLSGVNDVERLSEHVLRPRRAPTTVPHIDMARGMRTIGGVALFLVVALLGAFFLMLRSSAPPDGVDVPPPGATRGNDPPVTAPPRPVPDPPTGGGRGGFGSRGGFGRGGRVSQPPTSPTPAPAGPGRITDRFDEVDAALGELVAGNVAFNAPERMRFGESRTIALVASPALDAATLSTALRDRIGSADPIEVQALQIAPLMEAQLEGTPAFDITALTPIRQPVSRAAPTEWRWSVRANQTGTHALHLTINAIIIVAGERYPRSLDVLNRDIEVDITAAQRIGMFLEENWQWLLGTVAFPLTAWLWSRRRKQARKRGT